MLNQKGSLKEISIIKILLTIFEENLSGILNLKKEEDVKILYFKRGKLTWATSTSDEDKLEKLLLSQEMINTNLLEKVKEKIDTPESMGKYLLEKGLITLQNLVDLTKQQLKILILSSLKWKEGTYEFIKGDAPETFPVLDLNITDFIINFILADVDEDYIKKEIGSIQKKLIKNSNEPKIIKFNLSDTQKKLLSYFSNENTIENILAKHSDAHPESLLKNLYFFLLSNLLLEKKVEQPGATVQDKGPIEASENIPADIPVDAEESSKAKGSTEEDGTDIAYIFGKKKEDDNVELYVDHTSSKKFLKKDRAIEDRKKTKQFNLLLILVSLVLIIGAIILLILPDKNENIKKKEKDDAVIAVNERKPEVQKTDKNIEIIMKEEKKEQKKTEENKNGKEEKKEEKKIKQSENQKEEKKKQEQTEKPVANNKIVEIKKTDNLEIKKIEIKDPLKFFKEGEFISAGNIWRDELKNKNIKYTILLEMDCLKQSVTDAYNRLENKEEFFLLNRKIGDKNCFLVMWGQFTSEQEALDSLKLIPEYFLKQQNPPKIVELKKYL